MKRLASSASPLMTICQPTSDERSPRNDQNIYNRELHTMLDGFDEEGYEESGSHINEKKRRLSVDQVKALEKNFEVENKLEPERKVRLAQELGLQPRQVAVWFQNRRARWKTKQLERDYGVLKANYDALKVNYDSLQRDNDALLEEIKELRAKLNEEKAESNVSVKEETNKRKFENELLSDDQEEQIPLLLDTIATSTDPNYGNFNSEEVVVMSMFSDVKDGSSDSDSSAILNEEINNTSPNHAISSSGFIQNNQHNIVSTDSSSYYVKLEDVKLEEHDFFSHEEACDFFSDEQAPSLQWYCPDQWN